MSAVFVSIPVSFGSVDLGLFRVFRLLLDLSLEVCGLLPTPGRAAVWGPQSFDPHRSAAERQPALAESVSLCKCTHDQCVGAVFPSPPLELVAAVRPAPPSAGAHSSNACDSLPPSPHPPHCALPGSRPPGSSQPCFCFTTTCLRGFCSMAPTPGHSRGLGLAPDSSPS